MRAPNAINSHEINISSSSSQMSNGRLFFAAVAQLKRPFFLAKAALNLCSISIAGKLFFPDTNLTCCAALFVACDLCAQSAATFCHSKRTQVAPAAAASSRQSLIRLVSGAQTAKALAESLPINWLPSLTVCRPVNKQLELAAAAAAGEMRSSC